ncbi:MAG: hypothetical protein GYA35_03300, partial [Thermoanaerobaculaceae bacterium]|nr:hypothetical protein [Thermoanaerobaculaceae bacterium]
MGKVRIHELAKKVGKQTAKLIEELQKAGYPVKAAVNTIDESVVDEKGNVVAQSKKAPVEKEKPKEESPKPKEPEKLQVVTQAKTDGGRRVFRVSKSLTKIKEEELLPPPPPLPKKVEEKKEEKKEEKEEVKQAALIPQKQKVETKT